MAVALGEIVKGKVVTITKFGAFIELATGESGLCHISEISSSYIKTVEDCLTLGQEVTVKVVSREKGKLSLSIKQALTDENNQEVKPSPSKREQPQDYGKKTQGKPRAKGKDFESMLSDFMKSSDDKQKNTKKPSRSRRGNGYQGGRD